MVSRDAAGYYQRQTAARKGELPHGSEGGQTDGPDIQVNEQALEEWELIQVNEQALNEWQLEPEWLVEGKGFVHDEAERL